MHCAHTIDGMVVFQPVVLGAGCVASVRSAVRGHVWRAPPRRWRGIVAAGYVRPRHTTCVARDLQVLGDGIGVVCRLFDELSSTFVLIIHLRIFVVYLFLTRICNTKKGPIWRFQVLFYVCLFGGGGKNWENDGVVYTLSVLKVTVSSVLMLTKTCCFTPSSFVLYANLMYD